MDAKDILGLPKNSFPPLEKKSRPPKESQRKPDGISREVPIFLNFNNKNVMLKILFMVTAFNSIDFYL